MEDSLQLYQRNYLDNNVLGKINNVTEIKVCVMSIQLSLPGMPHTEVVTARPQSNNESNNFIIDMERASARVVHSICFELHCGWSLMRE